MRRTVGSRSGAHLAWLCAVQEVHLLIIFFLLLGTMAVYFYWRSSKVCMYVCVHVCCMYVCMYICICDKSSRDLPDILVDGRLDG